MTRAFLAIALPLAVRGAIAQCRETFLANDPSWRGEKWVANENLHVTLRFLGNVPDPACSTVAEHALAALSDVAPYRLRLDVIRAVPRVRSASLLWLAASVGAEQTAEIAARLADATSFLDFEPDGRAFKTHVTLVRARRPRRVDNEAIDEVERCLHRFDEGTMAMSVREVTLFGSTLTPRGPVYEELAVIPLGG